MKMASTIRLAPKIRKCGHIMFRNLVRETADFLLSVMFFGILSPIGFLIRMFGISLLDRNIAPSRKTYWVECKKAQPIPQHLDHQ
jgi:hypothetical protein